MINARRGHEITLHVSNEPLSYKTSVMIREASLPGMIHIKKKLHLINCLVFNQFFLPGVGTVF